jgi:hypothetical protein
MIYVVKDKGTMGRLKSEEAKSPQFSELTFTFSFHGKSESILNNKPTSSPMSPRLHSLTSQKVVIITILFHYEETNNNTINNSETPQTIYC